MDYLTPIMRATFQSAVWEVSLKTGREVSGAHGLGAEGAPRMVGGTAPKRDGCPCPLPPVTCSVLDIEGVAQGLVELDTGVELEVADWF